MRGRGRRQDSCLYLFGARTPAFLSHPSPLVTDSLSALSVHSLLTLPYTCPPLESTAKMRPTAVARSEMPGRTCLRAL